MAAHPLRKTKTSDNKKRCSHDFNGYLPFQQKTTISGKPFYDFPEGGMNPLLCAFENPVLCTVSQKET